MVNKVNLHKNQNKIINLRQNKIGQIQNRIYKMLFNH